MFKTNSLTLFRRFLFSCEKKCTLSSLRSSSTKLYVTMKQLIDLQQYEKALDLFYQQSEFHTDVTITIALKACTKLSDYKRGMNIQEKLSSRSLHNPFIQTSLIHFYMQCHDVDNAHRLFSIINNKSNHIYVAMFKGYLSNKMPEKVLDLLDKMLIKPDQITLTLVFSACAQLADDRAKAIGKNLLEQMPTNFLDDNILMNSVLNMAIKFGDVKHAEQVFQLVKKNDIISYGAMMKGYNINDQPLNCLKLFEKMKQEGIVPNEIIFTLLIGACSQIGIVVKCENIVDQIPFNFYDDKHICSSLVDMWGKVGAIKNAEKIFQSISTPDVISYTAMINSYGINGMGLEAIEIYRQMPSNLRDEVSHICVLNACSHAGLLDQARLIYNAIIMKTENITTVMIDCLSRLFLFDEAEEMINNYEKLHSPCLIMYMAMLSSARNARDSLLSQKIYNRMKSLFPDQKECLIAASILLGNTYLSIGEYEQAKDLRSNRRKQLGNKIKSGLSWTAPTGEVVYFRAHDRSNPWSSEIYAEIDRMSAELIKYGHNYDSRWITRPLAEDETIESVLCGHSEKLALAFNFIQSPVPSIIQIAQNLRVCGDCHRATKLIAKIRQCEIILRDANRIHHFHPSGTCSCQDHF